MAATQNEYRTYLRSTADMEAGQHRFHPPVQSSEPTYRSLLIGTLAVMGLLQVASSVAILLHLTGYLQEADLSTAPHRPIEEVHPEPIVNALKDTRKKGQCKHPKDRMMASAHLPIKANQKFPEKVEKAIVIEWDEVHGTLRNMSYQKTKLLVTVPGFYYVYAKTCFRYYIVGGPEEIPLFDVSNTQLIQYVYHESIKQNNKAGVLMKTGSTMRWNKTSYNMYCAQQGRVVYLDKGDALFVNVSNAWMLDKEAEGTYFGAIKFGN
ncbi:tumor necrosis factor ligand superfamily member 11 [Kryptolebias marmoratus]|uniref:TNF superfamily member 11 n=1 Tax=Kryptolebias marmoratus TaxID=37003 RepID=A0A3Q3EY15_KRYMA|nr:tumor necrosis factor ligand superfamily member 11 [Kryptolebias marmoratus]